MLGEARGQFLSHENRLPRWRPNALTRNMMAGQTKAHAHRLSEDTPGGMALWQSRKVGADQRCVDLPGPQRAAVWTDGVERVECCRPHTPVHTACRPAVLLSLPLHASATELRPPLSQRVQTNGFIFTRQTKPKQGFGQGQGKQSMVRSMTHDMLRPCPMMLNQPCKEDNRATRKMRQQSAYHMVRVQQA